MIDSVTIRPLDLPRERPVLTAAATMSSTPIVLIDVACDDGLVGRSYVRTYTPLALRALAALLEDIGSEVRGADASPASFELEAGGRFRLLGTRGLVGAALAGFDIALWDLEAKRDALPLARRLGATATQVRAYRPLIAVDPGAAAVEAEEAVEAGYRAVKLRVGTGDLGADLELARRVTHAVGPDAEVMVDYNQSLTVEEAVRRGRALQELGIGWIEEPVDGRDLAGTARVSAELDVPINLGENLEGPEEVRRSIAAGASSLLTLDAMRVGGVTGWLRSAADAADARIPVCSHAFPEVSLHLLAATATRHWLEHQDYIEPILQRPLVVREGVVEVPDEPGNGLAWDERAIERIGGAARDVRRLRGVR